MVSFEDPEPIREERPDVEVPELRERRVGVVDRCVEGRSGEGFGECERESLGAAPLRHVVVDERYGEARPAHGALSLRHRSIESANLDAARSQVKDLARLALRRRIDEMSDECQRSSSAIQRSGWRGRIWAASTASSRATPTSV